MGTDKRILMKGISYMAWSLPLMVAGPTIIHSAFKNEKHPLFIPVLGLAIILCVAAILLIFKGLNTIMKSMFDNEK